MSFSVYCILPQCNGMIVNSIHSMVFTVKFLQQLRWAWHLYQPEASLRSLSCLIAPCCMREAVHEVRLSHQFDSPSSIYRKSTEQSHLLSDNDICLSACHIFQLQHQQYPPIFVVNSSLVTGVHKRRSLSTSLVTERHQCLLTSTYVCLPFLLSW